jgi:hypothetical protein
MKLIPIIICHLCGNNIGNSKKYKVYGNIFCKKCSESSELRNSLKLITNYRKSKVICSTLKLHHEILKDDKERLSTEFLMKLIYNKIT